MPKILYLVTEDWFFVSHFLPMAQAARDCGLQVAVATRVREDGERLKAEGFSVIAIESGRGSFSPLRGLRDFFQAVKIVRDERADIVHCIALRPVVIGGRRGQARRHRSSRLGADRSGAFVDRARHRRAARPQDRERHRRLMAARPADPVSVRESR